MKGGYLGKGQPITGNLWLKNPAIMDFAWSIIPIGDESSIMVCGDASSDCGFGTRSENAG